MQNTGKRCVILLFFIILRWSFNYESNVFRYNKILIDCVFGNSKFLVPSTLTINLGFASVNSQCLRDNKLAIPSYPVNKYIQYDLSMKWNSKIALGMRFYRLSGYYNFTSNLSWNIRQNSWKTNQRETYSLKLFRWQIIFTIDMESSYIFRCLRFFILYTKYICWLILSITDSYDLHTHKLITIIINNHMY